jgi:RNA polymerase sigma-70 factor, ECF subfamily
MATADILVKARVEGWTDEEVVDRVRAGETALYEIILRRYNQRLYRVARAIVKDDSEAEDVMQAAYVLAYEKLHQFAGRSPFAAWLTKITVHEALGRLRRNKKLDQLDCSGDDGEFFVEPATKSPDPEAATSQAEMTRILEETLLTLPQQYRAVLMLRDIEEMNTAETAEALELSEDNVKVRLHRGRALLRRQIFARVGARTKNAFPFMGERCDRVVRNVLRALANPAD